MGQLAIEHRRYLEEKFGRRVSFHKTERKLYGHDIAALPSLVKPLVGNTSMGSMMRFMGKIPVALELMKPMFPLLFPKLLPLMMPKVMPVMLRRVAERVPMPDYMQEQMGELMPKVVNRLMPHMISDVVPLVTQPMIHYLKERKWKPVIDYALGGFDVALKGILHGRKLLDGCQPEQNRVIIKNKGYY